MQGPLVDWTKVVHNLQIMNATNNGGNEFDMCDPSKKVTGFIYNISTFCLYTSELIFLIVVHKDNLESDEIASGLKTATKIESKIEELFVKCLSFLHF